MLVRHKLCPKGRRICEVRRDSATSPCRPRCAQDGVVIEPQKRCEASPSGFKGGIYFGKSLLSGEDVRKTCMPEVLCVSKGHEQSTSCAKRRLLEECEDRPAAFACVTQLHIRFILELLVHVKIVIVLCLGRISGSLKHQDGFDSPPRLCGHDVNRS